MERYVIKDNKCLEKIPKITYGKVLPSDSDGEEGDIFLLIIDE